MSRRHYPGLFDDRHRPRPKQDYLERPSEFLAVYRARRLMARLDSFGLTARTDRYKHTGIKLRRNFAGAFNVGSWVTS